ncbi:MAG: hypothetical protein GXY47_05735 [Acidobacteria bacterium]|nr:hypothetical protein [Acidobacteriota bacterium]
MKTVRLILILILSAAGARAQERGVVEGRLVNRTDPSILPSGAPLEILELEGGMRTIRSAVTDAAGGVRIEGLPRSERLMLRASWRGVPYHAPLAFDAAGVARVELEVYETTSSDADIRVEKVQMAFQFSGDRIQALETWTLHNRSRPPRIYADPAGTFRISKAPGILQPPRMRVTAPDSTMPLVQPALESADGESYYTLYPLRPGLTLIEAEQALPYADRAYTFVKKFHRDVEAFHIGVLPADMLLEGAGIERVESPGGMAVYSSPAAGAGTEAAWTFSGGTPVPAASAPGASAPGAEEAEEGDRVVARPSAVGRNALVIGPLLLLAFILPLWYACNRPPGRGRTAKAYSEKVKP